MKSLTKIIFTSVLVIATGCSNIFKAASNQTTDEAKLEEIRKLTNSKNWDDALTQLQSLSTEEKAKTSTIEIWASVYAGRCGLDFAQYLSDLTDADLSTSTMFKYFMNAFTGVTVHPSDCDLAQAKMEEISTVSANRTTSQNLFMAILGMVKIGVYLRSIADVNGTGNLGNDAADTPADGGTYDSCDTTKLTKVNVQKIMTGLGLVTSNATALGAVLGSGSISDALDGINTVCNGSCGITDYTLVGDVEVVLLRNMLATGVSQPTASLRLGIDDTCNTDFSVVPCCITP
jgi:hypothetical protein